MRALALLGLTACQNGLLITHEDCSAEDLALAPGEVSHLGFSADQVGAWFGNEIVFDVEWTGWHSQTPPGDVFDVSLGAVVGDVLARRNVPVRGGGLTKAECSARDVVSFSQSATMASRDGQVNAEGVAEFTLSALDVSTLVLQVHSEEANLADERWAEIALYVDDDLPPAEKAALWLRVDSEGTSSASITADGEGYAVQVWKCDEQLRGDQECVSMTGTQRL